VRVGEECEAEWIRGGVGGGGGGNL